MDQLTQEVMDRVKIMLEQRERDLLADLRREAGNKEDYADVATEAPDAGDSSFADLTTDLGNAAIGRDLVELRAIARARERLERGAYGECAECGYPIPVGRLMAQPTAERCARCQEIYEKTHAGGRGGSL